MSNSLSAFDAASAFESIGDIAYLVSRDGRIADYNAGAWDRFAAANDGLNLTDRASVVGQPLLDFVTGEETRHSYRSYQEAILGGKRERIAFFYRCDAPEVARDMRMVIAAVGDPGAPTGVLYHSTVLRETMRPAIKLLDRALHAHDRDDWPIVAVCSYCKDVRLPGSERWAPPEKYYQQGGTDAVRLSHSICPGCYKAVVEPALQALEGP